jgi:predicted GNAT superfamily acetyltransferase
MIDKPDHPEAHFSIVTLHTAAQRQQAATLYRSVFGYDHPSYGLNPRLLAGLIANGGSAIGALDHEDRLVGFSYGFLGTDGTRTYHYSQAAVVAAGHQSHGLGRRLKLAQRDVALATGVSTMRWAYDPILTRNAHFNLDVLGARGVVFEPELYGEPGTDRIVVEWDLSVPPGPQGTPEPAPASSEPAGRSGHDAEWARPITDRDRILVPLPIDLTALRAHDPILAADLAGRLQETLQRIFAEGYQAVSCRVVGRTAFYIFRRPAGTAD